MSGRAKPPFGIRFGRKMAAIIGKIAVLAKSFIRAAGPEAGRGHLLSGRPQQGETFQSRRSLSEMATGVG